MIRRRPLGRALLSALLLAPLGHAWGGDTTTELVMFEQPGCPICLRWNREIAPIYPKTPESKAAPLRRVTLGEDGGIALAEPVRYTPTFVLTKNGREAGRMTGYLNDDMFWGLLDRMLAP